MRNSVYLPLHCEIIRIWRAKVMSLLSAPETMVGFCDAGDIGMRQRRACTNHVFRKWRGIKREVGHQKGHVIINASEKVADLFRSENLHYIRISFEDDRKELEFELIGNPFDL
ncbi:MAG: hypothetical protein HGA70_09450 [Chlorobiaceae bacterium]|nr:hypothetical protein [Chlorobiaceae bacterium]NTW10482.1 hypothetical protein [Chlorobiaceae bacterium]